MFIQRNYMRTEHDDFVLNVSHHIFPGYGALPIVIDGILVGWIIKPLYE